jgi:dUTP pyrophosphatase
MKVNIQRVDKDLELPVHETEGAVGFDIVCRVDTIIKSKELALIPGNVIVEVPKGYMLTVCSRSSTPRKKSLMMPHGLGIIDQDYHGPDDEILIQVYNFGDNDITVSRGDKIAQGIFVKIERVEWEEKESLKKESRGGFGSTG